MTTNDETVNICKIFYASSVFFMHHLYHLCFYASSVSSVFFIHHLYQKISHLHNKRNLQMTSVQVNTSPSKGASLAPTCLYFDDVADHMISLALVSPSLLISTCTGLNLHNCIMTFLQFGYVGFPS